MREQKIRVDEDDLEQLKEANNVVFDGHAPLGYIARIGAKELLKDGSDRNEVNF
ncbi:hypothetical protein [Haloferax volcanii]|uniref:hypothetical protein n=1 Tax=Haloferax volcanii TaxID=2246 RepID=UPI00249C234F|nr:hypothetical protein [Haloferax alexandrinus]WEL30948.1 hypothetical protein HBNXHx_2864 [Haloferax alexandrinus]